MTTTQPQAALDWHNLASAPPRWGTPRHLDRPTRGGLDREVAKLCGWDFFPWQTYASEVAGEYDPVSTIPCYRTVGVSVSRQNGKTTLVCSRIARQLIAPRQTVAYTAQDRGLATQKWNEHVEILMDTPFADHVERVERVNHREQLTMDNGSRYMPVTPSASKAARSLSIDLAVVDEAHAHTDMGIIGAIAPTMAARPHAQIWLLSNAGKARSVLWKHYTDLGRLEIENPASSMCWFEWAAEPSADVFDHRAWGEGNPSLGLPGGVLETALSDGALTMDAETFMREHLNIWADTQSTTGIDEVTWAACRRNDLVAQDQVGFGLDFAPERDRGALVVAGMVEENGELFTPIEVVEAGSDLERLVSRAAEVANRWDAYVVIDRGSPAASAIPALERATDKGDGTTRVRLIPLVELVNACGDFHDAAVAAKLTHRGDYRLTDAVLSATRRRVGDSWCWARRGHGDISPLVAATLARWSVLTSEEPLKPAVW